MKRNAFGDVICEPDDDPYDLFASYHDIDTTVSDVFYRFVEEDETFGWCCEIEADDGERLAVMNVHGFASREDIILWLNSNLIQGE